MGTISLGQLYSLGTHFPATERIDPAEDCLMFLTGSPRQPPIPSLFSSTLHQHQGYMDVPCLIREEFTGKSFPRPPPPPFFFGDEILYTSVCTLCIVHIQSLSLGEQAMELQCT